MFILSHGRADRLYTLKTLKKVGYTGDWFIVIDDEDKMMDEYIQRYGDKVVVFSKDQIAKTFDRADNFNKKNCVVYARNACFELAEKMGYTHFMEMDDDYTGFSYRFNEKGEFKSKEVKNLDFVMERLIHFYEVSGATCLAFAQGGDFIGGGNGGMGKAILTKRKAMNTMLCSTKRPFQYVGTINEDVNTYVAYGIRGKLFMTVNIISINQKPTQTNKGGLTDMYLDDGTYVKSFYTILFSPSSVKMAMMGNKDRRIHHKIKWRNTTPYILDESCKKI